LSRGWTALEEHERQTGQPFHSVLRARAEKVDLRSTQLAVELSELLNKPVSSDWVRQTLHRAREKFAEILIEEVAQTLVNPTLNDLEQELIDVDLFQYCRPAVERMRATWAS
jgi:RNA polymerase sigma-70 factor (ECF subfamily)